MNIDTGRRREEQSRRTEQPVGVDPQVRRGFDQVEEEIEALREDNESLRSELEERTVEVAELRETLDQRAEEIEALREEKAEQKEYIETLESRIDSLEGDVTCPHCGGEVRAGHVDVVAQEETPGDGVLSTSSFDGPAVEVECPGCGERIDMTDRSERERVEFTNRLREFGTAEGEMAELPENGGPEADTGE